MDAHGLLTELEDERTAMMDAKATHIGVGFAWNKLRVFVVELLASRPLMVDQMNESEDGGVDIRGMMLSHDAGIYAARIIALKTIKDAKKEIKVVGPPNIEFISQTKNFIIKIEGPINDVFYSEDPKVLEIYIRRAKIDQIPYGQASNERINVAHLELCMRMPMEYFPDPRTIFEDEKDQKREAHD